MIKIKEANNYLLVKWLLGLEGYKIVLSGLEYYGGTLVFIKSKELINKLSGLKNWQAITTLNKDNPLYIYVDRIHPPPPIFFVPGKLQTALRHIKRELTETVKFNSRNKKDWLKFTQKNFRKELQ